MAAASHARAAPYRRSTKRSTTGARKRRRGSTRRGCTRGSRRTTRARSIPRENEGRVCPRCRRIHFPVGKNRDESYRRYIKSLCWKRTRLAVLRRARWACQNCGGNLVQLHAHHLCYDRCGMERDEDLVALCSACHDSVHSNRDGDRVVRAIRTFARRRWGKHWEKFIPWGKAEDTFQQWVNHKKG